MYTGERRHMTHVYRKSPSVSQPGIRTGGMYTGEAAALTSDLYRENRSHTYTRRSSSLGLTLAPHVYRRRDITDVYKRKFLTSYVYRDKRSLTYTDINATPGSRR
jgi:hypothetical protein